MPSLLFDVLFLIAFFVPITMYVLGVLILMGSLLTTHWTATHTATHHVVAAAH